VFGELPSIETNLGDPLLDPLYCYVAEETQLLNARGRVGRTSRRSSASSPEPLFFTISPSRHASRLAQALSSFASRNQKIELTPDGCAAHRDEHRHRHDDVAPAGAAVSAQPWPCAWNLPMVSSTVRPAAEGIRGTRLFHVPPTGRNQHGWRHQPSVDLMEATAV
jgi:hypothetical protein